VTDSWLLDHATGAMVLRVDRPLAKHLGLDRAAEAEFLTNTGGIGPQPLYSDPAGGLLVTRYIEGETWRGADLANHRQLACLGRVLRDLHELPVVGKKFEPSVIANRYATRIGTGTARQLAGEAKRLAGELYDGEKASLCHHDVHAGNLVGERPHLLDWEYAAIGDPLMDLAVVSRFHSLGESEIRVLVSAWSGACRHEDLERLEAFGQLYDRIAELWQMVVDF
jgi:thiamine kinase